MLPSYPKIYAIGHKFIRDLFDGPVVVQEKVDGSQFSFGVQDGKLFCRSRGQNIELPASNKLFQGACATVQTLFDQGKLVEGWVYRGEAISRPKHNTLEYARVPKGFVILFDVDKGLEDRISPQALEEVGAALGLETVPVYLHECIDSREKLAALLDQESCLGGCKVEGVVVKNYDRFNQQDGKMMMGKLVSDAFKEKHTRTWKAANPGQNDKIQQIITALTTDARYEKGVQRRRDAGLLVEAPEDIGPIMSDIMRDTVEEEKEWIKEQLYARFEKEIVRGVTRGFPQWYKDKLFAEQFNGEPVKPSFQDEYEMGIVDA
jgi:hypothetical protein